jgi:hypothetical protein
MFQVVVEVCTGAAEMAKIASLFISSIYFISISIYLMSSIMTRFTFYERTPKAPGRASRLAHHAEGLAVNVTVSPAATTGRGIGRV